MMQMMFKRSVMADRDSGTKFTRTTASPEILPLMIDSHGDDEGAEEDRGEIF